MLRHYHWVIVGLTILNQAFMVGIAIYCFSIFSVPWIEKFDVTLSKLMIAVFAFQLMNSIISPIIGPRLDKISLRFPIVFGFCVFAIALSILAHANAYSQIIIVFALLFPPSVILSGTFVSQLLINRWFSSNKGLAIGLSATGTSLGGVILPPLVAALLSFYELPTIFIGLALFSLLIMAPLNLIALRVNPITEKQTVGNIDEREHKNQELTTMGIVKSRSFWIPLLILIPVMTAFTAAQFNLGNYLKDLNYTAAFTGQVIAIASFMMIVGKLLYGKLADNFDHRYLMLFMALMQILMLMILSSDPSKNLIICAGILLGIAGGGIIPLMALIYASRFKPTSFGRVMGLAAFFFAVQSIGSLYGGWVYDSFGNYNAAFLSLIGFIIPGIIALKWLPPPLVRTAD